MVEFTPACSALLQTRSWSSLLMKFVTHSTRATPGGSHLTQPQGKTAPEPKWGSCGEQPGASGSRSQPDLIVSVGENTKITVPLLPAAMPVIERLNSTGRRIWVGENVLTDLSCFWVDHPFYWRGKEIGMFLSLSFVNLILKGCPGFPSESWSSSQCQ